ncbi:hypothetical protein N7505_003334 [Penicillium chrysogenum]|uniref:Uncharacterized protein n=1 Tax=Penicillium chrysogenum TaxID=5076 RepID=A0ABQ8WR19_PENCH|nr:hypothetical protein N7505_003334 [Penicillium chrysogenum]
MCPPAPTPPTSATQPSSSPSASGTSESIGQQLVSTPGFWALLIFLAVCLAGAGYLLWRRRASKGQDPENIPPDDVSAAEKAEKIPEGDSLKVPPPPVTTEDPKTPAPSKMVKLLGSGEVASATSSTRNLAHAAKEGLIDPPAGLTGLVF